MSMSQTAHAIARMVDRVEQDPRRIGVLSTGEQIAVALVLNRTDLLPDGYTHVLDAIDRLGWDWQCAAIAVMKARR